MVLIHKHMPPAPSRKLNDNHRPDSHTNIVYTASKGLTTEANRIFTTAAVVVYTNSLASSPVDLLNT